MSDKREQVARAMWKSRNVTDMDDAVSPSLVEIYLGLADAAIAALEPAPVSVQESKEPDFCYNRQDWQSTFDWNDRDILVEDMLVGDVMEVGTLFRGPTLWVVEYDNSNGDRETSWFDNEADARALAEKGEA